MIKIFNFFVKKRGLTRMEFMDHYENTHVPLALSMGAVPLHYKRHYLVKDETNGFHPQALDFDVITEMAFENFAAREAWQTLLSNPANLEKLHADHAKLFEPAPKRSALIEEYVTRT